MEQAIGKPSRSKQDVVGAADEDESALEAPEFESVAVTDPDELPLSAVELVPASLV